ncbi:Fucoxanthin-chlorophyll a-c binding protein [Seminavis robusta]|uniref:Fucoxanthin-chlorophyll a-c binding protein n=1 Tax=Seminavis robusta TaxID=568900 RepID=A0A9N8DT78_9STRA|nr:Fucoxanthin-chlorophyll a-c binding protein [Seminavis robusta]|eukprot:Sro234_g094380.1 Fucoxanthin-chlorophyll a-c binding protein (204) ;mRNA; f:26886-27602
MKTCIVLSSLLASAAAFAPAQKPAALTTALNAEMSESLPFLTKPKNLEGYIGDVGFDPLGFSEMFDMKWLRESELKHGRVTMLATLGYVVQQFYTLPGFEHVDDSNLAPDVVGAAPMYQIIFGVGIAEFWSNSGNVTMENMFSDPKRVPGNLGYDPLSWCAGKSEEEVKKLELQELKNGRLAMLAIGGMIHHNWITGEPLIPI